MSRWMLEWTRRSWERVLAPELGPEEARQLVVEALDLACLVVPPDWFVNEEEREAALTAALDRIEDRNVDRIGKKVRSGADGDLRHWIRSYAFERAGEAVDSSLGWFLVGFPEEELERFGGTSWTQRVGDDVFGPEWRRRLDPGWRSKYQVEWSIDRDLDLVEEIALGEIKDSIRRQIEDSLSPRQHKVLWLHEEGRSHAEIGNMLGVSEQRSMNLKSQALRRLRADADALRDLYDSL